MGVQLRPGSWCSAIYERRRFLRDRGGERSVELADRPPEGGDHRATIINAALFNIQIAIKLLFQVGFALLSTFNLFSSPTMANDDNQWWRNERNDDGFEHNALLNRSSISILHQINGWNIHV